MMLSQHHPDIYRSHASGYRNQYFIRPVHPISRLTGHFADDTRSFQLDDISLRHRIVDRQHETQLRNVKRDYAPH